ncbi:hypothetical protein C1886_20930 [Pseudomonas sp. FW300-N1A1]|uniref:hypothetical protein n=1 Tax=Pseudomonas sp. FW300-N1A1 TaxID=2075555 RepID=UPI000CD27631|nr:hypothetical protein [Pseudomonas sp. FW300-N1A1]POA17623.1 hypothetical protein C1886_20930 [Pseudomonas sp. FW300-N1A1]
MIPRFVVVPAIPIKTASGRRGIRLHTGLAPMGFNLYDNQDKQRMKAHYGTRLEAQAECEKLNI